MRTYSASECAPSQVPQTTDYILPGSPSTWVDCAWTRDRRPIAHLSFYNDTGNAHAETVGNPRSLRMWRHPDGPTDAPLARHFDMVLAHLDAFYAQGFRRIILQLPAGVPFGRPLPEHIPEGTVYRVQNSA